MTEISQLLGSATREMREYQASLRRDPKHALISVGGLRHALIPTCVLARDLPRELDAVVGQHAGRMVMSQVGRVIGRAQAEAFFADRGSVADEATFRVLCGPMYLAWAGYGDVDILLWETSDDHFAILWESDNSFSACEALSEGDRGRSCHMQAGYAAGWCEAATGLQLETREIACRAEGVSHCRFLIGQASGFEEQILDPHFHRATSTYSVMRFDADGLVEGELPRPLGSSAV
jgi:hypothetical protein